ARGVQDSQAQLSQLQLFVVAEGTKRVSRLCRFMEAKLGFILRRQTARAGDMVSMNVRIDDVLQPEAALSQQSVVLLRLNRRVNNRRLICATRGNGVGGTSTTLIQELLKIHKDYSDSFMEFNADIRMLP